MDIIDFNSNFMHGDLVYFVASLAEIINKAISSKDINFINNFEIISEATGKRMGLSVNANQLKVLMQ